MQKSGMAGKLIRNKAFKTMCKDLFGPPD